LPWNGGWILPTQTEYTAESFSEEMTAAGLFVSHKDVRWGEIWAEVRSTD